VYAYCHSSAYTVDDLSTVFEANRQQTILEEKAKSDKVPPNIPPFFSAGSKTQVDFCLKENDKYRYKSL
jgi:hypothetical protein